MRIPTDATFLPLKRDFCETIAAHLAAEGWPVLARLRGPYGRNPGPWVAWLDPRGDVNSLVIRPYMMPCEKVPSDPAILRVRINLDAWSLAPKVAKRLQVDQTRNAHPDLWRMKLNCLPEELLELAPWVAGYVVAVGSALAAGERAAVKSPGPAPVRLSHLVPASYLPLRDIRTRAAVDAWQEALAASAEREASRQARKAAARFIAAQEASLLAAWDGCAQGPADLPNPVPSS